MEVTVKKPEVETLRVNIGEDSFEIPLGNSLSIADWPSMAATMLWEPTALCTR